MEEELVVIAGGGEACDAPAGLDGLGLQARWPAGRAAGHWRKKEREQRRRRLEEDVGGSGGGGGGSRESGGEGGGGRRR